MPSLIKNGNITVNRLEKEHMEFLSKLMKIKIFVARFNKFDTYMIARTYKGWFCGFGGINGECDQEGNGALLNNFRHDSIVYPTKVVNYALKILWEESNRKGISKNMLAERLQDLANWISAFKEIKKQKEPSWLNYYPNQEYGA